MWFGKLRNLKGDAYKIIIFVFENDFEVMCNNERRTTTCLE